MPADKGGLAAAAPAATRRFKNIFYGESQKNWQPTAPTRLLVQSFFQPRI